MRLLVSIAVLTALAATSAPAASAADTTLASDPQAGQITALDGTVVWVSGRFPNQTLMQHTAAVAADVYEYVFSQTVTGRDRHSFLAAASEGESDEHVLGLALGSAGVLWVARELRARG